MGWSAWITADPLNGEVIPLTLPTKSAEAARGFRLLAVKSTGVVVL
jgi:hypothetical protein